MPRRFPYSLQASEISDPGMSALLAEESGRLVGYVQLRWAEAPKCVSGSHPGEIQRLYVVENWHGKGVAQALMDASMAELHDRGSDIAWLGVWEKNPRVISFYARRGFVEVGDHTFYLGADPQCDLIMAKALAS